MRVTIKFNILITLAVFLYIILAIPLSSAIETPLIVESLFPDNTAAQGLAILLSITLSLIVGLLIIRAVWNRLFPHLCGWKEINLAEAYAISLFLSMFTIQ